MDYIVETKGLTKQYGDKEVVKDVDLKVPRAHVYGFMGPNGAGKSTTLKMILGLIRKSAGQVTIDGISVNRKNRIEVLKETGSLIESPSYYGHLTGRENLEIVRTLKNVPEQEIDQVLKLVRMESQQNKRVREYSLGMKQRLGLAAALLGRPELLILDEWLNYKLTEKDAKNLYELFEQRSGNNSTIFVGQFPVDEWHNRLGGGTQADSIMDRIIHNAYEIPTNETNLRKLYDSKKLKRLVDEIEA